MKFNLKKKAQGFLLMELCITMMVVAFGIAAILSGLFLATTLVRLNRDNTAATQVLVEKNETLRLYTWEQLHSTNGFIPQTFTNDIYTGTMTITDAPFAASYSNDMCKVVVRLDWKTWNFPRTRTWTTYVAKNGLHDYIY